MATIAPQSDAPLAAPPVATAPRCATRWLGRIGYREALALQESHARALKDAQLAGARGEEALLLLEHPPVITLGRNAAEADVLAGGERLASLGVTVDKRKVHLADPIKSLGTYTVPVKLHRDIAVNLTVEVVKVTA